MADKHLTIRDMATDDKPREKLIAHGAQALSNSELIAILLGTGGERLTAVELGQTLLRAYDNDLLRLYGASVSELCQVKGIGEAKACKIVAALALGSRVKRIDRVRYQVDNPADVAAYLSDKLFGCDRERFVVLLLDVRNRVQNCVEVSVGSIDASIVHPREVFSSAIRQGAAAIIAAHNHPSGDAAPSEEDIAITRRLADAGELLGIPLLDHLIVTDSPQHYFSFKNAGYL